MITAREYFEKTASMAPVHLPSPAGFAPGMATHMLGGGMPSMGPSHLGGASGAPSVAPSAAAGMGLHDKMDLAGLGILAAPAAYTVATGDKPSEGVTAGSELAGLGTLAGATLMRGAH